MTYRRLLREDLLHVLLLRREDLLHLRQRVEDAGRSVAGGGWDFRDVPRARRRVHGSEIRERAASVDSDVPGQGEGVCSTSVRASTIIDTSD